MKKSSHSRPSFEPSFVEVVALIQTARLRAFQAVNTNLIDLYWQVGAYLHKKLVTAAWGEGVIQQLANHITNKHPEIKGFSRFNLSRMRQFFEIYRDHPIVAPLVQQIPWSHHLILLARCKRLEEREFYLRLSVKERWSKRELERQLNGALFELGKDFCFVGEEYLLQVGGRDFRVDLLFYHRELQCLVAFELKIGEFEPSQIGQLSFYLEALDRNLKKPHERPSIGILLCASKNSEVVEYALSRSVSPTLVSEYQTRLPDRKILQAKLHEFYALEDSGEKAQ